MVVKIYRDMNGDYMDGGYLVTHWNGPIWLGSWWYLGSSYRGSVTVFNSTLRYVGYDDDRLQVPVLRAVLLCPGLLNELERRVWRRS